MILGIRLVVAAVAAGVVTWAFGTPELITELILFLPTFAIVFWVLGFLMKKD